MIISKFDGGLGNQMFQFAFTHLLSKKFSSSILFDLDAYKKQKSRDFELDYVFNLTIKSSPKILNKCAKKEIFGIFKYSKEAEYYKYSNIYDESDGNQYIEGFWQNQKYYDNHFEELIDLFTFKNVMNDVNANLSNNIKKENSVSLHVRRGDYIHNENAKKFHGECNLNYYKEAVDYISSKCNDLVFYLFSDDPIWVEENFSFINNKHIISHNSGKNSYEDMRLMSMCKHNIIANSSFSWWGAFLNSEREKIVIAPKMWTNFNNTKEYEIVPKNWIIL